jgi:hypothetical protein
VQAIESLAPRPKPSLSSPGPKLLSALSPTPVRNAWNCCRPGPVGDSFSIPDGFPHCAARQSGARLPQHAPFCFDRVLGRGWLSNRQEEGATRCRATLKEPTDSHNPAKEFARGAHLDQRRRGDGAVTNWRRQWAGWRPWEVSMTTGVVELARHCQQNNDRQQRHKKHGKPNSHRRPRSPN